MYVLINQSSTLKKLALLLMHVMLLDSVTCGHS